MYLFKLSNDTCTVTKFVFKLKRAFKFLSFAECITDIFSTHGEFARSRNRNAVLETLFQKRNKLSFEDSRLKSKCYAKIVTEILFPTLPQLRKI